MISIDWQARSVFERLAPAATGCSRRDAFLAGKGYRPKLDDLAKVAHAAGRVVLIEPNIKCSSGWQARLIPDPTTRLE